MSKCCCGNCTLEVFENSDKCILHCEKDDWYEVDDNGNKNWDKSKRNTNLFWKKIQEDLDKKYEESFYEPEVINDIYIYDNVVFPKFQEDITCNKYEDNQDKLGTNFYSYSWFTNNENVYREKLNTIISELNVSFKNCKFLDNVKLSRYNFIKDLDFAKCEFFGNFNLDNTNVKGRITFSKSFFYKKLDISFSSFSKLYINYSFIYEIKTTYTIFKELSIFSNNIFYSDVYFEMNTFEKMAYFRNSIFLKKLNLRDTIFKENKSFLGISFKLDNDKLNQMDLSEKNKKYVKSLEIEKEYFLGDRETARIIKDSFEKQNNIIEANKYYALEMKKREKELEEDIREGKNFFEWLVFKIHGLSSNHSQDWTLALFWIINLTFFYSYLNIQPNDKILVFKIIFSFIAIILITCMIIKIPKNLERRWLTTIPTAIVCYVFYGYLVENDWQLSEFSKNLNPFSIMRGDEPITLGTLIFKIIIAYLIYQLIISIRQNTRRK